VHDSFHLSMLISSKNYMFFHFKVKGNDETGHCSVTGIFLFATKWKLQFDITDRILNSYHTRYWFQSAWNRLRRCSEKVLHSGPGPGLTLCSCCVASYVVKIFTTTHCLHCCYWLHRHGISPVLLLERTSYRGSCQYTWLYRDNYWRERKADVDKRLFIKWHA